MRMADANAWDWEAVVVTAIMEAETQISAMMVEDVLRI
jgi:hypothetical protein